MRKLLFVILLLTPIFIGCKKKESKEGCMNISALNYDASATKDNGLCTFPTHVVINSVKIISQPNVNPQGQPWTSGGQNPDYFFQIKDHGVIVYQSEEQLEAGLPVVFNVSTFLKFQSFNNIMIHLFLGDGGQFHERNIVAINFSDYTQEKGTGEYPKIISKTQLGFLYEIGVTWK